MTYQTDHVCMYVCMLCEGLVIGANASSNNCILKEIKKPLSKQKQSISDLLITIISLGRLEHPAKVASDQRVIKDGEKGQRVEAREEMEPKRVEKEREREK